MKEINYRNIVNLDDIGFGGLGLMGIIRGISGLVQKESSDIVRGFGEAITAGAYIYGKYRGYCQTKEEYKRQGDA